MATQTKEREAEQSQVQTARNQWTNFWLTALGATLWLVALLEVAFAILLWAIQQHA